MQITITDEEYQELILVKQKYEKLKDFVIKGLADTKSILKEATGGDLNKVIIGGTERGIITTYEGIEQEIDKVIAELLK